MEKSETHDETIDAEKFKAIEELVYGTNHALETLLQLMIDKGFFTQQELLEKMDALAEHEDVEELGFDADAPRDQD